MPLIETESLIAFAKGLIALRTLATSGIASDHLEALAELSTSRDVISGVMLDTSLDVLARKLADIAQASEQTSARTQQDLSDERRLFDLAVPYALQVPHLLSKSLVDTDETVRQMLSSIRKSPMKPHWTPAADAYFKRVASPALKELARNNDVIKSSLPEVFGALLGSQARLEAQLQSFRAETRKSSEKLVMLVSETLQAVSNQSNDLSIQAITAIAEAAARRSIDNPELAIRSTSELMRLFSARRAEGLVYVRAEQLTMFGTLGLAASEADEKVASAQSDRQLADALDEAALHYLMTLDFKAASERIQRRAVLCRGSKSSSEALLDEFTRWYERGQASNELIYVEVAEALARQVVKTAPAKERWRHLINIGVACAALAPDWGLFRLLQARDAFVAAMEQIPSGERDRLLILANLGAIYQSIAHELGSPSSFQASVYCFEAAEAELEKKGDDRLLPSVRHAVSRMREARSKIESLSASRRNH